MIKILNITEEGRGGGALNRIVDIAKALQDNVEFHIICPRGSTLFADALESKQIPFTEVRLHRLTKKTSGAMLYIFWFIPEVFNLCGQIKKQKPNIVYVNGSWQIKGIIAAYLCKVWSVWHMNDMYQPKLIQYIFKWIAPLASSLVYASERTKAYYQGLKKDIRSKPSVIIPAPVDIDRFQVNSSIARTIVPKEGYNLITVGYINSNKGLDTLIESASILNSRYIDKPINFIVIGPVLDSQAQYKRSLDALIKKYELTNIHFVGFQANTEDWLAQSDLYICSSTYESSPIALWEALSCGKPIVSTDVGDVKKIIEEYECGIIIPSGDPKAMADAINEMIKTKDGETPKKSRLAAVENFSLSRVSKQHLAFYHQILKGQ